MATVEQKRKHSKNHGTYKGTKAPTTGCPMCLDIFNKAQLGFTPPTGPAKPSKFTYRGMAPHPLLAAQTVPEKTRTYVTIVLDSSGSMSSIANSTRLALKKTFDDIKANAQKNNIEVLVSFRKFSDYVNAYEFSNKDSSNLPSSIDFWPGGYTALLDAAGCSIMDMTAEDAKTGNKHSFLLIVITDGEENRSGTYNSASLARVMRSVQATDRYTLTFQLPPKAKSQFCRSYGIPEGNVIEWEGTDEGIATATAQTCSAFSGYAVSRAQGKRSTTSYYTTDLSRVSKVDLNNLMSVNSQTRVLKVTHEADIKPFVEAQLGFYRPGSAFYQLTKTEKIQSYKVVLIRDKSTRKIYAGNEARQLIGLPNSSSVGSKVGVKPGNHANFDVFIQSSSNNRKLVRGTDLIIWQ